MIEILIACDGESWVVQVTPEMRVGGFSSETAAGAWLATYFAAMAASARDSRADILRAALIASDPRGKTS